MAYAKLCDESNKLLNVISYTPPMPVSKLLAAQGVSVSMPCGGARRCGNCRVRVSGQVSPVSPEEEALLRNKKTEPDTRLACFAEALGDVTICLPKAAVSVLQTDALPTVPTDGKEGFGVAIDIGTTTLVAYLVSLKSGEIIRTLGKPNPQCVFGADVISRLERYEKEDGQIVRTCLLDELDNLIKTLLSDENIEDSLLKEMTVVGNTAMLTILCGYSAASLLKPPFTAPKGFGTTQTGAEWRFPFAVSVPVYVGPCVSGYVGADAVAALLAADMSSDCLLADIGTNGELLLRTKNCLYACSAAAGPALEGAGISCGMPAGEGAVSRVYLRQGRLDYTVIGDGEPRGICGSGLLDLLSVCGKLGVISGSGQIQLTGHVLTDYVQMIQDVPAIVLSDRVTLTQEDVYAIQLSKSAIASGIRILLREAGLSLEKINTIYLAGGFGSSLSPQSAETVGLIPPGCAAKTVVLGNAAGKGAVNLLLSETCRKQAAELSSQICVKNLNENPDFEGLFLSGLRFDLFRE